MNYELFKHMLGWAMLMFAILSGAGDYILDSKGWEKTVLRMVIVGLWLSVAVRLIALK